MIVSAIISCGIGKNVSLDIYNYDEYAQYNPYFVVIFLGSCICPYTLIVVNKYILSLSLLHLEFTLTKK